MIPFLAKAGDWIFRIATGVLAVVFLAYGLLSLWDMYRTEMKAFASYDLLKYRPNIEENEPPYLDDLLEINPDTASWLTIYNTNIDYPVMQGKNDSDYLNKDVYGNFSISGSIFMASQNSKDFSDPYTLIYGHHMANGSMFGDILKFKDEKFFDKNDTGVLIMPEKVYDLKIMACLSTDAYDHEIYWVTKSETDSFMAYVKSNAMYFRDEKYERLLALSTCDSATTAGRTILVCAMTTRTDPLPDREYGKPIPHREPVGHPMAGAYWALVNFLVLLVTVYYALKYAWLKRKDLDRYVLIEAELALVSIFLFIITEDTHKPIQMVDVWTLPMILILLGMWLINRKEDKDE